jgi:hypothetical protein
MGFNITFIKTHVEVVSKQRNYTKSPVMQHSCNRLYEVLSLDNSDGQKWVKPFSKHHCSLAMEK